MEEGFGKSGVRMSEKREDINENREERLQNEKTQLKRKPTFNF